MANTAILASGWTFEVGAVAIGGITSFTIGHDNNQADISDFDDPGVRKHVVTSRGQTVTVEGNYLEDSTPGTGRDAGQDAVEVLAAAIGTAAVGELTIISPGGTSKTEYGSFKMADYGGGNEDPTKWGFEFTRTGTHA
jgi:hypothetical protein